MTSSQEAKCQAIIHSYAAAAANVVPVPGLGADVDTVAMTTMAIALASVFGQSISQPVAQNLAILAIKRQILAHPIKQTAKEVSKFIPILGRIIAPALSLGMLEAAGWSIAYQFDHA